MAIGYKNQDATTVQTPGTGETWTFIDTDGKFKRKDESGTVVSIEDVAAGVTSFEGRSGTVTAQAGDYTASEITNVPTGNISSTTVQTAINELDTEKAPQTHVGSTGVSEHGVATGSVAGFMSPSDKTKLDGVTAGATLNDTDANLRARASHTGTQTASTISDFNSAADSRVAAGIATHELASDPHPQYTTAAEASAAAPVQSVNGETGVVVLDKSDIGLGSVDNTADTAKPVSVAQAAADTAVQNFSIQRANHTGTQTASTISDFNTAADARVVAGITGKVSKSGDTMTGPLIVEGDLNGTGVVNLKSQSSIPATPASGVSTFASADEMFSVKGQSGYSFKLNDQNLTDHRQFDLPDVDAQLMADPMTAAGSMIRRNALNQNVDLPIGAEDEILRVVSGLPEWVEENLSQDIGGGGDGNATLTGSFTAPDILYYNELTIGPGTVFNPDAYIIYAKKLDLTNAPAGAIIRNGNPGTNSANNTGGAGGAAFTARVLATAAAGGAGAAGQTNAGVQGAAGGAQTIGNGGNGGASGASGAGGTGAAAAAIAGGAVGTTIHFGRFEYQFIRGATQVGGGAGGRGGNSGGGDGANSSRGGGGGGAGGAVLVLIVGELVTGGSTPAGVIQAKGGRGGSQTSAPAAGNVGGAGGGGGGGGGYIYLAYVKKTGPVVADLLDASGGNGGNGSNGLGTGVGGNGGQGGTGGRIQLFNVTEGMGTLTVGSAGSNGTVGVGTVGGTGGQGGSCNVSL